MSDAAPAAAAAGSPFARRRCRRSDPRADPGGRIPAGRAPGGSQDRGAAEHQPRPGPRGVQAPSRRGPAERGTPPRHVRGEPVRRGRPRDLRAARRARGEGGPAPRARPGPRDARQLRALVDGIDAAVATGDAATVSRADLAFHEGLCRLCGNSRILEVFDRYVPTLRALLRIDEQVLRSFDEVSTQHRDPRRGDRGRRRGSRRSAALRARRARRRADRGGRGRERGGARADPSTPL